MKIASHFGGDITNFIASSQSVKCVVCISTSSQPVATLKSKAAQCIIISELAMKVLSQLLQVTRSGFSLVKTGDYRQKWQ